MEELIQTVYVVHESDTVATALANVETGIVHLTGKAAESAGQPLIAVQSIPFGHKIALQDLLPGASVVKYGSVIGQITQSVARGAHVSLHNMKSLYDERAASFNAETAASTDMEYTVY